MTGRRSRLLGIPAIAAVGVVAALLTAFGRPWHEPARASAEAEEPSVERTTLRPGQIVLVVKNDSPESVRVAQIIVNDAFVNFRAPGRAIRPGRSSEYTIDYPWTEGEAYEIELLTSTGATIEHEITSATTPAADRR